MATSAHSEYRIELTDKAAGIVRQAFEAEQVDPETAYLRVGAHPGGCSGYKFDLGYANTDEVGDSDQVFTSNGINVVVDQLCLTDILGSVEIDYQDENFVEQGFKFRQLIDGNLCGCGESFTPIKDLRS